MLELGYSAQDDTSWLSLQVAMDQKAFILLADRAVAAAGCLFQTLAIGDRDRPSDITNQSGLLKHAGGNRNSRTVHAKHLRQKVLSQRKRIFLDTIVCLEEPSRATLVDGVDTIAGGALRNLV
jgi:hypothetical protein